MDASKYILKLANALNDFRKQNQLCDVTINIGGRAFHVHKAVLAACSCYFMAMFTSGFSESTQSEINIEANADVFEILMEFTYTGKMKITPETAFDILEMACYMQFTDACETYSTYIGNCYNGHDSLTNYSFVYKPAKPNEIISVGDVYKIAKLASCHDTQDHLKQLARKSLNNLSKNLKSLKCSDVFLRSADMNFVNSFLKQQSLSSKEEEKEVLEMVVNWLKQDWSGRSTHALKLLQKVRLGFVPGETLKNLLDATILEIPGCKKLVDKVLELQEAKHSSVALARGFPSQFATRSTVKAPVISTSPDDGDPCDFHYYDLKSKTWKRLSKFKSLPHLASLIVVNERLYAVGGIQVNREDLESEWDDDDYEEEYDFDPDDVWRTYVNNIFCYDAEKNKWKRLPSTMKIARHNLLLVHMDGFIYAIGGNGDEEDIHAQYEDIVERYDMKKKEWQDVASLPEGFTWTSAVVFQGNLLVYGVGDPDERRHVLVVYNSNTNTWASKLSEQRESKEVYFLRDHHTPALFVHKEVCYRVMYQQTANIVKASVNILKFDKSRRNVTIQVGEAIPQVHIPNNKLGAFRIHEEVFMNIYKSIYKTGLKISAGQSTDVNLDKWSGPIAPYDLQCSNGVSMYIDIKRLSTYL